MSETQLQCPWDGFEPADLAFQLCEEQLCAWVVQPASTWSSVAYLLAGLAIYFRYTHHDSGLKYIFIAKCFLVGLFSALFHLSFTAFGQVLDLAGVSLFVGNLMLLNIKRLYGLSFKRINIFNFVMLVSYSVSVFYVRGLGLPLIGLQALIALVIEAKLYRRGKVDDKAYKMHKLAMGAFGLSLIFYILDIKGIACEPHNHYFSGHAAWHCLGAVSLFLLYRLYARCLHSDGEKYERI